MDHQIKLKNGAPLSETQSAALRMRILRTRNARKASRSAFNLSDDTNGLAIKSSHLADANAESSDDGSLDITHKGCRIKDLKDDTLLNDDNGTVFILVFPCVPVNRILMWQAVLVTTMSTSLTLSFLATPILAEAFKQKPLMALLN